MTNQNIKNSINPEQRFKKVLQQLGKRPTYQYLIIAFVLIVYALIVFNTMIGAFVFMNPIIECGGISQTEEQACKHFQDCRVTNDFTAAYKNNLFCDKELIRSTIQSIFGLGYIIGKVSFPLIADIIGRRKSILIVLLLGILAMIFLLLGIEYGSEALMMAGQLIAGILGSGIGILSFIYVCDFCTDRIREICLTNCWAIWGISEILFYPLYFYMPEWKFYLSVTLLIPLAVLFILILYFLVESPVYAIFVKKNPKAFNQIVDGIGKFTKSTQEQKQAIKKEGGKIISLLKKNTKNQLHLKQILQRIFCVKKNLIVLICLILTNIGYVFFFFGMQGAIQSIGFNFGVNMLVLGATQFCGFIAVRMLTKRMNRKSGLIIFTVFSSTIGFLFLINYIKEEPVAQIILVVLARVSAIFVYCFFVLFESQILEVQIRNTCFAIIDGTGEGGRIVAPYIINIMYNLKLHPIIAFSAVFILFGAVPVIFLKETFKKQPAEPQDFTSKSFSDNSALLQDQKSLEAK